ncbi:MAG: SH3 domain-containing protein [Candidatus Dojkabacteria bacterium]|nr:SH3 domain-containing protein [Candidatus Dojkabacteria bacterium]
MSKIFFVVLNLFFIVLFNLGLYVNALNLNFISFYLFNYTDRIRPKIVEEICLINLKTNTNLEKSEAKIVQEILYFFKKLKFEYSPVFGMIFDTGNYYITSPDPQIYPINTDDDVGRLFLFLISYNKNQNFSLGINNFYKNFLNTYLKNTAIDSPQDLYLCTFKIAEINGELGFALEKQAKYELNEQWDFSKEDRKNHLTFHEDNVVFELNQGEISEIEIEIKNNSDKYFLLLPNLENLLLSFEKNSNLFINNVWLNTRTPKKIDELFINSQNTQKVHFSVKAPLLPGEYEENINLIYNNIVVDELKLSYTVKDLGRKILQVKPGLIKIFMYEEPNTASKIIGEIPANTYLEFFEKIGNFYKIKYDDLEGYVSSNAVIVIKQ